MVINLCTISFVKWRFLRTYFVNIDRLLLHSINNDEMSQILTNGNNSDATAEILIKTEPIYYK